MKTALGPKSPPGVKFRGANFVGSFGQVHEDTVWAALWRVWDWDNWIRPNWTTLPKWAMQ